MTNESVCTAPVEHGETVRAVKAAMPSTAVMQELAEQYKLFGDPTRVKLLWALTRGPLCVCDLAEVLGSSQSAVSHQLRLLRQAHLVRFEKKGKSAVYCLDDDHVEQIIRLGLVHVTEERG